MFKAPFSFTGRIRRLEYFLSMIICGALGSVVYFLGLSLMLAGGSAGGSGGSFIGTLISIIVLVFSTWFSLAQGVKRLHDLNKTGWLILLSLIPVVNFVFALYLLFADGTPGPNLYGKDPKNRIPVQQ